MNIDFHFGVVYILARTAGLSETDAETVAHACEYVDDATTGGELKFAGGQRFERYASAHEMIDYRNEIGEQDREAWVPFHFVPGNEGDSFEDRLVCQPNSAVAQALMRDALTQADSEHALHRLGVTLHAYIDTWAHQKFCGIVSEHNRVRDLVDEDAPPEHVAARVEATLAAWGHRLTSQALDDLLPLGHGAALTFPDLPWARWHYVNGKGIAIRRENLNDFMAASDAAYQVLSAFAGRRSDFTDLPPLPAASADALREQLALNRQDDPNQRLDALRQAASAGKIPGVTRIPAYIGKGAGSWKHLATGIDSEDDGKVPPQWTPAFELSDYRKFHDAVKRHRFTLLENILPQLGLRVC